MVQKQRAGVGSNVLDTSLLSLPLAPGHAVDHMVLYIHFRSISGECRQQKLHILAIMQT